MSTNSTNSTLELKPVLEEWAPEFKVPHPSPRFIGLQFFFKSGSLVCFALVMAILRQQNKEASVKATVESTDLQQL